MNHVASGILSCDPLLGNHSLDHRWYSATPYWETGCCIVSGGLRLPLGKPFVVQVSGDGQQFISSCPGHAADQRKGMDLVILVIDPTFWCTHQDVCAGVYAVWLSCLGHQFAVYCHAWDIILQFTVMPGTSVFHVQFAE
jgi:hypothetical protein